MNKRTTMVFKHRPIKHSASPNAPIYPMIKGVKDGNEYQVEKLSIDGYPNICLIYEGNKYKDATSEIILNTYFKQK